MKVIDKTPLVFDGLPTKGRVEHNRDSVARSTRLHKGGMSESAEQQEMVAPRDETG